MPSQLNRDGLANNFRFHVCAELTSGEQGTCRQCYENNEPFDFLHEGHSECEGDVANASCFPVLDVSVNGTTGIAFLQSPTHAPLNFILIM